jgi:capsular exopolysaccharide synthesis family protein
MTFEQFWSILIKQWKLIVICILLVGVGAYAGSKLMTPLYQSTVVVQIAIRSGNNQADINSLLASDQLVQTEAQLAISGPVLQEVASHYKGLTAMQLSKEVTATPTPNTQLFQIDVLDPSPARAAALANDIASTLIRQQLLVVRQDNLQSQQQIQQDINQTQQQIDTTTNQIAALQAKGGNSAQISSLEARLNTLQQHDSQWQLLLAQLELAQAQSGDFLRIAQPAQPADSPARPSVTLNTGIGLLAGLFLGLLLALLIERLDTRVRTPEALLQLLDWPVLATVWRLGSSEREQGALVNPQGHSANVESFHILRTNIGFSVLDKPLHTIMVTSAAIHEGKSVTAANLAIFMAKAGKSTLLIDADLRRPTLHEKFHLWGNNVGLSNAALACSQFQIASASLKQQLTPILSTFSLEPYMHSTDIPNLRLMPSGPLPPNPPELLDSKAMERFFEAVVHCGAEVIIFDTPPLLGLSDASILASKVDGTVVVVDITHANKKNLKQVKALLTQAGAHVLGCVVNKQRASRKDTAYSYYYRTEGRQNEGDHRENIGKVPVSPIQPASPFE